MKVETFTESGDDQIGVRANAYHVHMFSHFWLDTLLFNLAKDQIRNRPDEERNSLWNQREDVFLDYERHERPFSIMGNLKKL